MVYLRLHIPAAWERAPPSILPSPNIFRTPIDRVGRYILGSTNGEMSVFTFVQTRSKCTGAPDKLLSRRLLAASNALNAAKYKERRRGPESIRLQSASNLPTPAPLRGEASRFGWSEGLLAPGLLRVHARSSSSSGFDVGIQRNCRRLADLMFQNAGKMDFSR